MSTVSKFLAGLRSRAAALVLSPPVVGVDLARGADRSRVTDTPHEPATLARLSADLPVAASKRPKNLPVGTVNFTPSVEAVVRGGVAGHIRRTRRNPERALKNALRARGLTGDRARRALREGRGALSSGVSVEGAIAFALRAVRP